MRTWTDADTNFERFEMDRWTVVERVYRHYTNSCNFEMVEGQDTDDGDKVIRWIARGTGMPYMPVATVINGAIHVRGEPLRDGWSWGDPPPSCIVRGGKGLPIVLDQAST